MKRSITLAVILAILIAVPVLAQSGVSLESLSARVDSLFQGQAYLNSRINALETSVAVGQRQIVVVPTATPIPSPTPSFTPIPTSIPEPTETATMEPSATPTRTPSVTPTPTQASARVTADRRLSLRRAPGNSSIIAYINLNNQFEVIGKNLDSSWMQVNYNGQIGWLQARYAEGVSNVPIVSTPTPLPKPTVRPTDTPVPTPTMTKMSDVDWELILTSIKQDLEGSGRNPESESFEQLKIWVDERIPQVNTASKKCDLSVEELFEMMEPHALRIEESGLTVKNDWWARWSFTGVLADREEGKSGSCNWYLEGYVEWLLDQEKDE